MPRVDDDMEGGGMYGAVSPRANASLPAVTQSERLGSAPEPGFASLGRASGVILVGCAVVIATALVSSSTDASSFFSREADLATQNSSQWKIEKYTINLRSGTGASVNEFLRLFAEPTTECASDLGCGALRAWCGVTLPFDHGASGQLHFVDGNNLLNDLRYKGPGFVSRLGGGLAS